MQSLNGHNPRMDLECNPSEMVNLHVSCRNLKDLDILTKSDPQVHFYTFNEQNLQWTLFGKTEEIKDNLNPDFQEFFSIVFQFEKHQKLRFEVLDIDPAGRHEYIGYIETSLGVIMGKKNHTLEMELRKDRSNRKRG